MNSARSLAVLLSIRPGGVDDDDEDGMLPGTAGITDPCPPITSVDENNERLKLGKVAVALDGMW